MNKKLKKDIAGAATILLLTVGTWFFSQTRAKHITPPAPPPPPITECYNRACYHAKQGAIETAWKWFEKGLSHAKSRDEKASLIQRGSDDPDLEPIWPRIRALLAVVTPQSNPGVETSTVYR